MIQIKFYSKEKYEYGNLLFLVSCEMLHHKMKLSKKHLPSPRKRKIVTP